MSKELSKTLKIIYKILFSATTAIVASLLVLQVLDIYFNGGENPYTPQTVSAHFYKVVPFLFIWIFFTLCGFALYWIFPEREKLAKTDDFYSFSCVKIKLENKEIEQSEEKNAFEKTQRLLLVIKLVCGICVGICSVSVLAYLFNKSNFKNQDQNGEAVQMALYLLPFVLSSFALCIGATVFEKITLKKQLPLAKLLLKSPEKEGDKKSEKNVKTKITEFFECKETVAVFRLSIAVVGITLLIFGLATGGNAGVLAKAVNICRQCIGLG